MPHTQFMFLLLCVKHWRVFTLTALPLTPFCDGGEGGRLVQATQILKLVLRGNPMHVVVCSCLSNEEAQAELPFPASPSLPPAPAWGRRLRAQEAGSDACGLEPFSSAHGR